MAAPPMFVPAIVETAEPEAPVPLKMRRRVRRRPNADGIELEIAGVDVRIGSGAKPQAIEAVIRALKANS
jgi:transposase